MADCALLSRCLSRRNNFRIAEIFSHGQGLSPMFINDTGRLPESGRVCVVGFHPGSNVTPTYYDVAINAARAEFERMAEPPRNPAHVLGVGSEIQSLKGPVFAAYFAATRERFDAQPNYKDGLYVLIDGAVYGVRQENIGTSIRRGIGKRAFTLLRGDRPQRSVEYAWPWYRQFGNADDFLHSVSAMVQAYGTRGAA